MITSDDVEDIETDDAAGRWQAKQERQHARLRQIHDLDQQANEHEAEAQRLRRRVSALIDLVLTDPD
jgi:hypothetical protein